MSTPTTRPATQHTVHTRRVDAAPEVLYDLVADVSRWPVLFGPTLHVAILERAGGEERFQLWALVAGEAKTWTSRRRLDPDRLQIDFQQERTQPPIASMSGAWMFRSQPDGTTEVTLEHTFAAVGEDPSAQESLAEAVDRNSTDELAALGRLAELGHKPDDLAFAFEDVMSLPFPKVQVYDYINRADLWHERLPHVGRVVLQEPQPGVQDLEMDTVTAEGRSHTTRSIRLCFAHDQIVYKQLVPPEVLLGHCGAWQLTPSPDGDGTVVTARHQVAIDPAKVEAALGSGATLADARVWLRDALGANSRATLAHAGGIAS